MAKHQTPAAKRLSDAVAAVRGFDQAKERRAHCIRMASKVASVREIATATGLSITRVQGIIREGQVRAEVAPGVFEWRDL